MSTANGEAPVRWSTSALEAMARECIDELRNRGRALGIEADQDLHSTGLRVVEKLATSASAVEQIARATLANEDGR